MPHIRKILFPLYEGWGINEVMEWLFERDYDPIDIKVTDDFIQAIITEPEKNCKFRLIRFGEVYLLIAFRNSELHFGAPPSALFEQPSITQPGKIAVTLV